MKKSMLTTKSIFTAYENLSIRNVANTIGISYHMLLKASKKPIPGVPYDPEEVNYDAMDEMIAKKEINLDDFDWKTINDSFTRQSSTVIKDVSQFQPGMQVYLRNNKTVPYNIIYTTDTHVVIMLEGSTEPQAWKWSTFMFHGPSNEPRTEKADDEQ